MQIHFQIEYLTRWGESLYLCLTMPDSTRLRLDMSNNGSGIWFTDYTLDYDSTDLESITYFYIVETDWYCLTDGKT